MPILQKAEGAAVFMHTTPKFSNVCGCPPALGATAFKHSASSTSHCLTVLSLTTPATVHCYPPILRRDPGRKADDTSLWRPQAHTHAVGRAGWRWRGVLPTSFHARRVAAIDLSNGSAFGSNRLLVFLHLLPTTSPMPLSSTLHCRSSLPFVTAPTPSSTSIVNSRHLPRPAIQMMPESSMSRAVQILGHGFETSLRAATLWSHRLRGTASSQLGRVARQGRGRHGLRRVQG